MTSASNVSLIIEIDPTSAVGGLSPRSDAPDPDHVAMLAAIFDQLPPIVVHEPSTMVIDGAHRLLAARELKRGKIRAVMWRGTTDEAQIEAIRLNVAHGRPLPREDRERAVGRVLCLQPDWSDRRIADTCGVAASTVETVRARMAIGNVPARVGRDGRARTTDPAGVRLQIAAVLAADPDLSNREIARRACGSEATVRDVRRRQVRGEPALPERYRRNATSRLAADPALHSDHDLRRFAGWLESATIDKDDWLPFVSLVPLGRVYEVIDEARRRAESWQAFALELERRTRRALPRNADR